MHRPRKQLGSIALLVSLCSAGGAGCIAPSAEVGSLQEELRITLPRAPHVGGGVVQPVFDPRAQIHMKTGRNNSTPASWYFQRVLGSNSGIALRTVCSGRADTGMLLRSRGLTKFNDNASQAGGNGKGSYLAFARPRFARWETFTATVFSMKRATASCRLESSTNQGSSWNLVTEDAFGGTTVNVGPLQQGDFVEVQATGSSDDVGSAANDKSTQLLLFDSKDESKPALFASNGGSGSNPRINIADDSRTTRSNWVLLGKRTRSTARNAGVEVRVDLVHGPLDTDYAQTGLNGWKLLQPGRYYAWVHAKTSAPIGTVDGYYNPSNAMVSSTFDDCPGYYRGRLDGNAFRMQIERWQPGQAKPVRSRQIRLAQMGASANVYNAFVLPLEVTEAGYYRALTSEEDSTVALYPNWRIYRNPDASELTAVTWNTLYDTCLEYGYDPQIQRSRCLVKHNHTNKTLNASNLLATRGSIQRSSLSVEEARDQAPFQWDADIIGLTELREGNDDGHAIEYYANLFRDEAVRRGSSGWSYVWGRDEEYSFATDGAAPLFVASPYYPAGSSNGIHFSEAAKSAAGCDGGGNKMMCELDDEGISIGQSWYSIIGKSTIRRFGHGSDRPITVVNLHLKDGDAYADRVHQLHELIDTLKDLLRVEPRAFNPSGSTSPLHYQNRIILLGDFNMSAHHCGEHYWILRMFRQAFGYALDTSMAVADWDGHDSLGSLAEWTPFEDWQSGDMQSASYNDYPWWLTTYRGKGPSGKRRTDRYDGIMLAGRGWAYDDPVVGYQVMNDRSKSTVMGPGGRGVEMWANSDLVANGTDSNGLARGYRPNYRLSLPAGVGTNQPLVPGEPALDTDHLPVRARLRVFQR